LIRNNESPLNAKTKSEDKSPKSDKNEEDKNSEKGAQKYGETAHSRSK
jgi:hypothetical protein